MTHYDCLIVGTGHAGAQTALMLRQHKFSGTIGLIGEEPDPPYERPPLSKYYLSGEKSFDDMLLRPPGVWQERNVNLLLGKRVDAVDSAAHSVICADGSTCSYGQLVWATGGKPRRLTCSGHHLPGVHSIRCRADADLIRSELDDVSSVAIIGGGYIGLEAAAVLACMGKKVVVLEALDRVLARVAGEPLSRFYEHEHRAHGVDIRVGVSIDCIEDNGGRACGVRLTNGERIPADMVIVGIGITPTVSPLLAAGAIGGNGVKVDEFCRTSLPNIFAIGDCALHANTFADGRDIRLESVQNAMDQAMVVAKTIAGDPTPYRSVPWFWSKQYDLNLQTVGLSVGFDDVVLRGNPADRKFSVIYLRQGRVLALDCVNSTKDYVQGRVLVERGMSIPASQLADTARPLKPVATSCPSMQIAQTASDA